MNSTHCAVFILVVLISNVNSAKILGLFTIPSVSHQLVFQPIWKELSLRGHEVTVLTTNPLNDPSLTNLTEIDISFMYQKMEGMKEMMSQGIDHWALIQNGANMMLDLVRDSLGNEKVQNLIKDNTSVYDVVIIEAIDFTNYAFAAKYKCPVIAIASLSVMSVTHEAAGNPGHPTLQPDFLTPYYGGEMTFFEKVDAVLFELYQKLYFYDYVYYPALNSVIKEYFGDEIPDIQTVEKNISMLFLNTNPVIHGVRPYGANVIEFGGGIHMKPPKPLPNVRK